MMPVGSSRSVSDEALILILILQAKWLVDIA
jgi:hypothetical protein